ncbi:MAG: ornithine carbamoyltransferase [Bryobacteraceae bacterium]
MPATFPVSPVAKARVQDLTTDLDLSTDELLELLDLAHKVKATPARYAKALSGRYLSLLFEKPSLRTRLTFELAIKQLGGDAVTTVGAIGDREPLKDIARNLDRWTDCIVARTFSQKTVDDLALWSKVPVVNALTDLYHPCQALADICTMEDRFGSLKGKKLAFVGDGNNVAHSLMLCASRLGMDFALAHPSGYTPNQQIIQQAERFAAANDCGVLITHNPAEAVAGAHGVYTDVWASMGQEDEAKQRRLDFQPYQVNEALMAKARPDAVFMHCLPAKRGEETTDAVMESAQSVVFDQAEYRLHAQKALLLMMLG